MELLSYTRQPKEDIIYGGRMAYSMHLAYRGEDGKFRPFHHNEGLLYARALQNPEDGTLDARCLKKPWLFELSRENPEGSGQQSAGNGSACRDGESCGGYGILAVRTGGEGETDASSQGCVLFFVSRDLVHYEEKGLCRLQESGEITEVRCVFDGEKQAYRICWQTEGGQWMEGVASWQENAGKDAQAPMCLDPASVREIAKPGISAPSFTAEELELVEGVVPGNTIVVPEAAGEYLLKKLLPPVCVGMALSKEGPFRSVEELKDVKAVASYSDGTTVVRKIDWEEPAKKEAHVVRGRVHQEHFPAPFAEHRADPVCMYRDGKYYFIATNDADNNHTLYMRCADTLEGILTAEEELFLDSETYPGIGGLLWAPEFHEVDGQLYVFHAATSGEFYHEESRVRKLREGGDPICREDWSAPMLVVKKDGSPLCEEGKVISLDMTTIPYEGKTYVMWSQRQFLPVDQGAWLYLAQIDEKEPWKLVTDPVCIAKPEYGWENNHTYVVEGPYALERDGQLMITYAAAAVDATYTVGLLKPVMGSDILNPDNWSKSNYPLMSSASVEGEYGTGHNSYLTDENGLVWNFYHMRAGVDEPRSSAARRTHFDIDGEPMLDVTEEIDLPEAFRTVEARIG